MKIDRTERVFCSRRKCERAARFAARCAGGADMFWSALESYMGKTEVKRLRSI